MASQEDAEAEARYERVKEDPALSVCDYENILEHFFESFGRDIGQLLTVLRDGFVDWRKGPKACLCLYNVSI